MKEKTIYQCSNCGYQSLKWVGRCSECNEWNTVEEAIVRMDKKSAVKKYEIRKKTPIIKLSEVQGSKSDRIITRMNEFNRVMGGGIVRDSITIITSPPGGGKSTLTLAVANDVASKGYKVLYASGEESDSQIKNRADRILDKIDENIWIIADTSMDYVLQSIEEIEPDLIIVDSIQTFTLSQHLPARAGNPTQTMECSNELLRVAKNSDKPKAVIMIGQMNKNDEIAGLRALEHLVDTVLVIEGEDEEELRAVLSTKNRFGSTGEMGFFSMTEKGLLSIDNPSEFFMTKRDEGEIVSGSALTVLREGSRPIIAEIESLVSNSFTPYPSRIGEALRREQLNTLISILEQRGGINLFNKNVVIKTTGGIKLKEQAANLSVIMSIASSVYNIGISNNIVFIADVGLTGELKKVPALESRIKELARMGFKKVYVAKNTFSKAVKFDNIDVIQSKTLQEVIQQVFGVEKP
ncbi:DNA repair protein RadA [Clostridium aceticum]|uniref:DNA repair protein RadA n=1 Tax=Clostridium aceticum TaxID=84022 RepID=A0A0D8I722_9CLOT|nr:DNA repair protein RadA [Clostridium aceticum]AKL97087.1 DNA repair protein RadA [Clostridium aceticum]KJF26043.1 DNA repair protein RadA [Clostridium aceticum]